MDVLTNQFIQIKNYNFNFKRKYSEGEKVSIKLLKKPSMRTQE